MKISDISVTAGSPTTFTAGSIIFSEGDRGEAMFIVKEGEVELRVHGKVVETVVKDNFFGEMALLDGESRTATAIARTDCKLVPIDKRRFMFMVQETPFFALLVMKTLSSRLRNIDAAI